MRMNPRVLLYLADGKLTIAAGSPQQMVGLRQKLGDKNACWQGPLSEFMDAQADVFCRHTPTDTPSPGMVDGVKQACAVTSTPTEPGQPATEGPMDLLERLAKEALREHMRMDLARDIVVAAIGGNSIAMLHPSLVSAVEAACTVLTEFLEGDKKA